jgi:hypothetical protein
VNVLLPVVVQRTFDYFQYIDVFFFHYVARLMLRSHDSLLTC